ncbi:hypothetical protein EYR38_008917 [Pleurotus pulmonarius]|nr:hypothetical protein EYR38_008917 [Pleurotus pulmonarius]
MSSSPASRSSLPAASSSDNDLKRYLETTNSSSIQDSYPTQDNHSFIPHLLSPESHSSFTDVAAVRDAQHEGFSPPRQDTSARLDGHGSPMHISHPADDDAAAYGGPSSSSMSQESSTPASAFSIGSISPLGTLAFAEANPLNSSFAPSDINNSKDSPMLTDPPTMYMDGYALEAPYMHDVDGYVGTFGFIPSSAPESPYHLAYGYLHDTDTDRGVLANDQSALPSSVPTSALFPNTPNTGVEPTEGRRYFVLRYFVLTLWLIMGCLLRIDNNRKLSGRGRGRGRGRGKARSAAVTSRAKMSQAGRGSPRGHLTLDTASINANDRGPDVGSPGRRKRSVNEMDVDKSSDLLHDGSKDGSNTEGSDDREAKRARTQSDSMISSPPLASSTRRHRATSLASGSAPAMRKGKFRQSVVNDSPQSGILHTTANESTSIPPSPLSQVLPTISSADHMWRPQSDSNADSYGHTTGDTTDTSARSVNHSSAVEPESGEGSNEGSAFEDEEDGSEYEDDEDDDDEYVQGRSSGRRKSTSVRRTGKSGGKNVSAAWALEKVQGGSGGPIIDTSTFGASDENNDATNMYNRNGKTRRKRTSNIPLPIPVPNLTKKSRGRKVPSFPADLASSYGYDASAESSPSGYASREGTSKRGTRGRRVPAVVGGPSLEERPFVCEVSECNKRFVRGEHLKRHVRSIHTLDKPFICPQKGCGKTFSRRDNLGQHARVHITGSG